MEGALRIEQCRIRVQGTVQGVSFRWYTRRTAAALGLAGWVRNQPDGSVEILAEGLRPDLERLIAWARTGPPSAEVDEVTVTFHPAEGCVGPFAIRS